MPPTAPSPDQPPDLSTVYHGLDARTPIVLLPVRLETRYFAVPGAASDVELRVRIYPDALHVAPGRDALSGFEQDQGRDYWNVRWVDGADAAVTQQAWARLVDAIGDARALYVARRLTPSAGAGGAPQFPVVEIVDDAVLSATARALPTRWALYRHDQSSPVLLGWSRPVTGPLAIDPPAGDASDPTPPAQRRVAPAWLEDFAVAESVGMAIRVRMTRAVATGLGQIFVIGVDDASAPSASAAVLASLLIDHGRGGGVDVVPVGTATNNTEVARAGYDSDGAGSELSRAVLTAGEAGAPAVTSNGGRIAAALGIPVDTFRFTPGAHRDWDGRAADINRVLWPSTWGRYLDKMLTSSSGHMLGSAAIERGRQLFVQHVRARGALSPLRTGAQPYGVLPALSLVRWRATSTDGNDQALVAALAALWLSWQREDELPRVGRTADAAADLLAVLAMSPTSGKVWMRALDDAQTMPAAAYAKYRKKMLVVSKNTLEPLGLTVTDLPRIADMMLQDAPYEVTPLVVDGLAEPSAPATPNILAAIADASADQLRTGSFGSSMLAYFARVGMLLTLARGSADDTASYRAALRRLGDLPAGELRRVTVECIDLASHRLDAWISAMAGKRLAALRGERTTSYLGGFGWLEGLQVPQTLAQDGAAAAPVPGNHGYLHAPTLGHAQTAAVLRAGYVSHRADGTGTSLSINLSSDRVKRARWLLEAIQDGQSFPALLGYRAERAILQAGLSAELLTMRAMFPLTPRGDDSMIGSKAIDGRRMLEVFTEDRKSGAPWWFPRFQPVYDELTELVDAAADVLVAESVHQTVQGQPVRARAALEVLETFAGSVRQADVVRHQVDAERILYRAAVVYPERVRGPFDPPIMAARALAIPELEAWAGRSTALITLTAEATYGGQAHTAHVALRDVGICLLDVAALSGDAPAEPGYHALVRYWLRKTQPGVFPEEVPITITLAGGQAYFAFLARALRAHIGRARALTADDLRDPGAVPVGDAAPSAALVTRAADTLAAVRRDRDLLPTGSVEAVLRAAALVGVDALAALEPAAMLAEALTLRIAAAEAAPDARAAIEALIGRDFPVPDVLTWSRPTAADFATVAPSQSAWIHDLGRVRPAMARFGECLSLDYLTSLTGFPRLRAYPLGEAYRLIAAIDGAEATARVAGITVDAWTEARPTGTATTGLSFHYDDPNSRPPQAVLVAVPPDPDHGWSFDNLATTVAETLAHAKLRLAMPPAGRFLPATLMAPEEDLSPGGGGDEQIKKLVSQLVETVYTES